MGTVLMMTSFTHDSWHLAETYERVSDLQFEGEKRLVERLGLLWRLPPKTSLWTLAPRISSR